ncbi:MAG: hypothetical protein HQM03_15280 [Magnetococcales bacterium]|nr:hypothetical protein [Magnetococcales bacterium]
MFNITIPFPGTEMFEWARGNGYLTTEDWDDYEFSTSVMHLPTISPQRLEASLTNAYRRFYLRPSLIRRKITQLRSWSDTVSMMRGVVSLVMYWIHAKIALRSG